jgi:aldose sugar dehydrogenase
LDGKIFVFLSYTESENNGDGSDVSNNMDPLRNRLYRYQYVDGKLIDPALILDLTVIPNNLNRIDHNGGKVTIGPDNNVYEIRGGEVGGHRTRAQNMGNGPASNGLGGVLRISQDGILNYINSNTLIFPKSFNIRF